jgi:hypothetical protein
MLTCLVLATAHARYMDFKEFHYSDVRRLAKYLRTKVMDLWHPCHTTNP